MGDDDESSQSPDCLHAVKSRSSFYIASSLARFSVSSRDELIQCQLAACFGNHQRVPDLNTLTLCGAHISTLRWETKRMCSWKRRFFVLQLASSSTAYPNRPERPAESSQRRPLRGYVQACCGSRLGHINR